MKNYRPYFSIFDTPQQAIIKALKEYKEICWSEPDEADKLRDTVISRKRLMFYRWMYRSGQLTDG